MFTNIREIKNQQQDCITRRVFLCLDGILHNVLLDHKLAVYRSVNGHQLNRVSNALFCGALTNTSLYAQH